MDMQSEILDSAPYGTLVVDGGNGILFANQWVLRQMGRTRDELVGSDLTSMCNPSPLVIRQLSLAREQGRPVILSQRLHGYFLPVPLPPHHVSGFSQMQQETTIVPLAGQDGRMVITIRDVTSVVVGERRIKQLQRDLEEARERAERSDRNKGRFLAMISHDIRTPMNGLIGYTELLLDTELNEHQRGYAETVHSSGHMLLNLVNDILDYSKIEDGKLRIRPKLFSVSEAVEDTIAVFRPDAARKGVDLKVRMDAQVPLSFFQDGLRFRQVLSNLVSNAVKFTDHGEVAVDVAYVKGYGRIPDRLEVAVNDTGPGISPEGLSGLFEAYQQLDHPTPIKGTGLGLYISRQLSQLMGGDVRVESEPGRGSVFRFTVSSAEALPDDPDETRPMEVYPPHLRRIDQSDSLRVLVVDDSPTNCRLLGSLLGRQGHQIESAADGNAAASCLTRNPYDLVIMDLLLPNLSGFDLAKNLRQGAYGEGNRWVALCSLSGLEKHDISGSLTDYGFHFHLRKPIDTQALNEVVRAVLEG